MIIFCGDSWSVDYNKPNQWNKLLTQKLYNTLEHTKHLINLSQWGCSNDSIFCEQLVDKVLPLTNNTNIDYLILCITYPSRFRIFGDLYYQPSSHNGFEVFANKIYETLRSQNNLQLYDKDQLKYWYDSMTNLNVMMHTFSNNTWLSHTNKFLHYIKNIGIKVFVFDVNDNPNSLSIQLDKEFYFDKIFLSKYSTPFDARTGPFIEYSNHMTESQNIETAHNLYNEIISK